MSVIDEVQRHLEYLGFEVEVESMGGDDPENVFTMNTTHRSRWGIFLSVLPQSILIRTNLRIDGLEVDLEKLNEANASVIPTKTFVFDDDRGIAFVDFIWGAYTRDTFTQALDGHEEGVGATLSDLRP